ncbi:ribosome silencing factor [Calothrix sp. PCC 6303]|uniref:ribosome silencing factor n=1 Tax=Calothrix sp. PCC 6303 TaxID=1170562 RepID=UPI0002A03082|nr:ribosome silencing factor [Calothrix sp. PCC 6303]AFY99125.1 iojap-like protein [Calothrix sp. PCC 6303]
MSDNFPVNFPSQSVAVTNNTVNNISIDDNDSSAQLALSAALAGSERKAADICLLKISEVSYLADYFVVMTGYSRVQVRAIADSVEDKIEEDLHRRPLRSEGKADGNWILHDYGDVIVHVMMTKEREFYNLEAFWGHGERIEFSPPHDGSQPI